jgi:L-lactate dehydrogenase complex protein LldG
VTAAAREEVLARIRGALGDAPTAPPVARHHRQHGDHEPGTEPLVAQLIDRLQDYRATVLRTRADDPAIGTTIAHALSRHGIGEAIAPPGVPAAWLHGIPTTVVDDGTATPRELDRIPAVITGSVVAISETGTLALDGSPRCGRRAITLVPDTHVCVVRAEDIVQTVPEGLTRLDPTRPLTLVSGPSATSDIELSRVEGVHGPRSLIVVVAG